MPNIVLGGGPGGGGGLGGARGGGEGKGKIVDVLAPHVGVVVRYQGGNNAGHTVVVGREKFVLQSIPSGILHPGVRCVIGCGVVFDPSSLIEEMESLVQRGVSLDGNLYISKNAHLIMPYHPALDRASESQAGQPPHGPPPPAPGSRGRAPAASAPPARAWAPPTRTRRPASASAWRTCSTSGCSGRSSGSTSSRKTGWRAGASQGRRFRGGK